MKLMVSGSRGLKMFLEASMSLHDYITSADIVIHGDCKNSPDMWADEIATKLDVPIKKFPADWNTFGRSAGFRRNSTMVLECDMAIIIWDGESKGAKNVIDLCRENRKTHLVVMTPKGEKQ